MPSSASIIPPTAQVVKLCEMLLDKSGRRCRYRGALLEGLREPGFQKLSQLCRRVELRYRIQFLESGGERIEKTPNRPRLEFLILRFEVEIVHGPGKMLWSLQFGLDESFVNHNL